MASSLKSQARLSGKGDALNKLKVHSATAKIYHEIVIVCTELRYIHE